MSFNLKQAIEKTAGYKKIKDRGISWKEEYKEKSARLKDKFDKLVGPGSYHRWEGHDYTSNSEYYVVVGPAIHKTQGKSFFAGIKKLPKDPNKKVYSPYGVYFSSAMSALSYASNKWGVRMPVGQINYTREMLQSIEIPRHIK